MCQSSTYLRYIFLLLLCPLYFAVDTEDANTTLHRIAFGSCHNRKYAHFHPTLWPSIASLKPQVFLWNGDAVYAPQRLLSSLESEYNQTQHHVPYANFLSNTSVKIMGTWDDHDFGVNDGGAEVTEQDQRKQMFLNFLNVPSNNSVWKRPGVYSSHVFGVPPHQTKIIFLDTRSFRDLHYFPSTSRYTFPLAPIVAAFSRWLTAALGLAREHPATMLGETQWKWLESELRNSSSQVHILVSSVQVLTTNAVMESWGHFHLEKLRLLELLRSTRPSGLVMLSGDVHHAEVIAPPLGGDLLEVTSSGLTHSCTTPFFGFMCPILLDTFFQHRLNPEAYFTDINFGTIDLDWASESTLQVNIHDEQGNVVLNISRPIRPLEFSALNSVPELLDGHGKGALALTLLMTTLSCLVFVRCLLLRFRRNKWKKS